jgi:poly(ribitol-phosphate) beta-N-acetylglucosaminyltransferase
MARARNRIRDPPMPIKVSVVVPVYNPGRYIEPCIASIVGQTLPKDEYEAIFVDDGSTDETPARLDALAAQHPNIRVIHQPNSGWPGKPRNVGIAAARGEYIQLIDQDDALGPEALARLHAMAVANDADIAVGKVAANFRSRDAGAAHAIRSAPYVLFRWNRERCSIRDSALIDSLTPHKFFRTAFLREHGLAFPDGTHRLEDQLFVVPAYFAAGNVSVLSDYVCYCYQERDDGRNAGSFRIDPPTYYGDLRKVIGIVIANTEPGAVRTRLLGRFHRIEMLGRLAEPNFQAYDRAFQRALFDAVRPIAVELIDPGVDARLGAVGRVRSRLLREGAFDGLVRLAENCAPVSASAQLDRARWNQGRMAWTVTTRLAFASGEPVTLIRRDGALFLDPRLIEGVTDSVEVTHEAAAVRTEVVLVDQSSGARFGSPGTSEVELVSLGYDPDRGGEQVAPVIHARGNLDLQTASAGRPLERGSFDFWARVTGLGLDREVRVVPAASWNVKAARTPALLAPPARFVVPAFESTGSATLVVDPPDATLKEALAVERAKPIRDGPELWIALPVAARAPLDGVTASLALRHGADETLVPAGLRVRGGRLILTARPGTVGRSRGGVFAVTVRVGSHGRDAEVPVGDGRFRFGGRFMMEGPNRVGVVRNIRSIGRESARALYVRLPAVVRRRARGVGRRLLTARSAGGRGGG